MGLPRRVLVVDDDAMVGAFVARWLSSRGCEVVRAGGGRAALREAGKARFDAALLDVDLGPGDSGVRVLLMSGDPANEARVGAARLGPMLLKPFEPAELEGLLRP